MEVTVHASSTIGWHREFARRMEDGLRRMGVRYEVTQSRQRISEHLAILLGTSAFRAVEATGPYLLVDRCSFGDTNHWVTLVRDGHGRRGDHRVPEHPDPTRWERYAVPLLPWHNGRKRVLCGQTETYSPHYGRLEDWYFEVYGGATHFRRHPAGPGPNGLELPEYRGWDDVGLVVTLNSSVAVDAVLNGIPAVTMDEAAMAWDVTSHRLGVVVKPPRLPWLHWLAWTQWTHDEIAEGVWQHLL